MITIGQLYRNIRTAVIGRAHATHVDPAGVVVGEGAARREIPLTMVQLKVDPDLTVAANDGIQAVDQHGQAADMRWHPEVDLVPVDEPAPEAEQPAAAPAPAPEAAPGA
jgi:hypothetical protein